jgi:hypothetical protein
MLKTVYIETSIPSYYYESRPGLKFSVWREITRKWWKTYRQFYQTVTSDAVFAELNEGTYPHKQQTLSFGSFLKEAAKLRKSRLKNKVKAKTLA